MAFIVRAKDLEPFLQWLDTCPCPYSISSMQSGFVHVKFLLQPEVQTIPAPEKYGEVKHD